MCVCVCTRTRVEPVCLSVSSVRVIICVSWVVFSHLAVCFFLQIDKCSVLPNDGGHHCVCVCVCVGLQALCRLKFTEWVVSPPLLSLPALALSLSQHVSTFSSYPFMECVSLLSASPSSGFCLTHTHSLLFCQFFISVSRSLCVPSRCPCVWSHFAHSHLHRTVPKSCCGGCMAAV